MYKSLSELFQKKSLKIIALALAILTYYSYSFGHYDIAPSDEDVYFHGGKYLEIPMKTFWNLLYPFCFNVVLQTCKNFIDSVYIYNCLLSIAMFLSLVFFLKSYTKHFWLSFFISVCVLFSTFQVTLQPRITIMNLTFGLFFLGLAASSKFSFQKWGLLSLCLLLCNYVARPEFYWFFVLSFLVFIFTTIRTDKIGLGRKLLLLSTFSAFIGFLYFIGGGINEPGKLKIAFVQHFFDNYQIWTGKHFDYDDEFVQFNKIYGNVNSDLELITVNPAMFFKHVITNVFTYFKVMANLFKYFFYDFFVKIFGKKTVYVFASLILVLGCTVNFKQSFRNFISEMVALKINALFIFVFILAPTVAVLLIYPRYHYAILHLPFYLLLLAFILKSVTFRTTKIAEFIQISAIFIYLLAILNMFPFTYKPLQNVNYYRYMLSRKASKKLVILNNDIFGFNYFGDNYIRNGWNPTKDNLVEMLNSGKYDIITFYYLDLEVEQNRQFVKEGYKHINMVRVPKFESFQRYIWVKPELKQMFE